MKKQPESNCCHEAMYPVQGDEGTGYYACIKCNKACDQYNEAKVIEEEMELQHCKLCNQMTNHRDGKCLKSSHPSTPLQELEDKKIESFLMYINPDDRDMARGALQELLIEATKSSYSLGIKDGLSNTSQSPPSLSP